MDISDIICTKELTFEEMCDRVRPIAVRYGLKRICLFGSRARGDNHKGSDYDFLIVPGDDRDPLMMLSLICDLEAALRKSVDVIDQHMIRSEVAEEVLHDGRLVYEA